MPTFFKLRLQLQSVQPAIWRQVLAPPQLTLAELHELIQAAMGWGNYRSYRLLHGEQQWGPDDLDKPGVLPASATTLGDLMAQPGDTLTYRYHMKHLWDVQLVHEGRSLKRTPGARLLEGARNCPPEEVPGPAAYAELVAARLGGPQPEDPYLAWLSDHFDPEAFDLKASRRAVRQWFGGSIEVIALTSGLPVREVAGLLRFLRDHIKDTSSDVKMSLSTLLRNSDDDSEVDPSASDPGSARGGLSQAEMEILITAPFSPHSPLKLSNSLDASQCETAPFFVLAQACLQLLNQAGEWPLDADKNLLPDTVAQVFREQGEAWPDATQTQLPQSESAFFPLAVARQVLQHTRLVRVKKRRPALVVTRRGKAALTNPALLFGTLLEGFCRYFPWASWDQAEDDAIAQWGFGFSLLLLRQFGDQPRAASYYAERYLRAMPTLTGWDATEDPGAFREQFNVEFARYVARTFDFFTPWWGFTLPQATPVSLITDVAATPLLLAAVVGTFPQSDDVLVSAPE
jgi:hypothetical protein